MKWSIESKSLGIASLVSMAILGTTLGLSAEFQKHDPAQLLLKFAPAIKQPRSAELDALIDQGHGFYIQSCAHCHADDASGDEGPDLHRLKISDGRISHVIKNGIKGEMPSFSKKYGDPEIAALRAYLRSLD